MIKKRSCGNHLEFYISTLKVTALILTVFGLFAFGATQPACAGASRIDNSNNFRRPANDDELKYWLKNMVWYHRFTNAEITAATGFNNIEIVAAMEKFNIRPDNRTEPNVDSTLIVLPYRIEATGWRKRP